MKRLRISIAGFGTVGQGLAELLYNRCDLLQQEYNLDIILAGVANARSGFIYREDGLDIPALLQLAAERRPLTVHPGVTHWESLLEGLRATGADILVEATPTNLHNAEPGISHIRAALSQGMHVVTANKGPGALAANELFALDATTGKRFGVFRPVARSAATRSAILATADSTSRSPRVTTSSHLRWSKPGITVREGRGFIARGSRGLQCGSTEENPFYAPSSR